MLGYLLRYRKEALAGHHMALDMGDTVPRARATRVGTNSRVAGLTLHATDLDGRVGSGPVVSGPTEALMVVATELSGPVLRPRLEG
jgi:hypothetical protein